MGECGRESVCGRERGRMRAWESVGEHGGESVGESLWETVGESVVERGRKIVAERGRESERVRAWKR